MNPFEEAWAQLENLKREHGKYPNLSAKSRLAGGCELNFLDHSSQQGSQADICEG